MATATHSTLGDAALDLITGTPQLQVTGNGGKHAARLAAMGFGIGYLLASLGPLLTGALRDITGSYGAPFALYGGVSLLLILIAIQFAPHPPAEA